MAEDKKKNEKLEKEMYEGAGKYSSTLTIPEIELHAHPEADRNLAEEVDRMFAEIHANHVDKESHKIKDADKAADDIVAKFAKLHFGEAFEKKFDMENEDDRAHVLQILQNAYGIRHQALKKELKKGRFRTVSDFITNYKKNILSKYEEFRMQHVGASLQQYMTDPDSRKIFIKHLENRVGAEFADNYKSLLKEDEALGWIRTYMQQPGSLDVLHDPDSKKTHLDVDILGRDEFEDKIKGHDKFKHQYEWRQKQLEKKKKPSEEYKPPRAA